MVAMTENRGLRLWGRSLQQKKQEKKQENLVKVALSPLSPPRRVAAERI